INQINSLAVFTTPPALVCSPTTVANCLASAAALGNQTYVASATLRAPYTMQFQIGGDHQLFRGATVSVNYLHTIGVHQFLSRVSSTSPTQYQYISEGEFRQNQIIANFNLRNSKYYSLAGFYSLNFANGDASGASYFPTNSNNIKGDYGRTTFSTRNRLFLSGTINAPFKISLSPFVIASSGSPYNLTTGTDVNGDSKINDRPSFANGSSGRCTVAGDFVTPALGTVNYNPVPINYCTGPTQFVANLRVSRTFGFGPLTDAARARAAAQNGPGGGGPGGERGGGGRGGPGGGGGRGGGFGSNTGHQYNLSVGAQAQNLFNYKALSTPVGVLSSKQLFGTSTQLAGRPFTNGSAVERLQLFLSFNF
ncbi:MAG: carboxypeptidase regulatory-like domain-containing protein, partial [Granulicella sp.]